nr:hypothetical protein [Tanacetum cinerariifolium]GEW93348.1 hypothetical protein [Tanacetum cinerariifolium]
VENNDDSDGEVDAVDDLRVDNSISNSKHEFSKSEDSDFDNPSVPLPTPEPLDEEFDFKIDFGDEILVIQVAQKKVKKAFKNADLSLRVELIPLKINSTRKDWCEEFETLMQIEFEMSSMGPLTFFLGLQVDQRPDGIFIHQEKEKNVPDEPISVHLYRSMIGCLMYLTATRPDIMFACKKKTITATSPCEAKYVAAASCCGQRTKHIEIRHHFIMDRNEKKPIQVLKIPTEHNVADLLTKSFDVTSFGYLMVHIVVTGHFCWSYDIMLVDSHSCWCLVSEVSLPDGVKGLEATIDGTSYTVTEASIRSTLQLDDLNAKDTLTNAEIFDGLRAIGYAIEGKFMQSSPSPIPFSPAPSSGIASTNSIPEIPSSSRPTEPVLEKITSPIRDDDTNGGSFHKSPPTPPPSKLKSKKRKLVLSDSKNEEEARQSQELDALLHLANAALHDLSASTTPFKPDNQEQHCHLAVGRVFTGGADPAVVVSAGGVDPDVVVSAGGADPAVVVFAGGADPADVIFVGDADSAGTFISAGVLVAAGPSVASAPSSPIRDPTKGKVVATPSSPRVAVEQEREIRASSAQSRQAELDRIALNLTNEEWIGLVDQVQANPTLSAEFLGADVSEDTFSVCMVELMNRRGKAIAEMKAKAKRDKPMTPAQKKGNVYNKIRRAVDLATAKDHHQQLKRSGDTLESLESKKLKSSHSTEQSADLPETTSVSAGATLAAGDPISAVPSVSAVPSISVVPFISAGPSVSAASFIPAETPIAAGVSITAGVSASASVAYVPIINLLDSPPKATSLPLDPAIAEQAVPLRKSLRKKSMARRRTLPRPSQSESAALPFNEDDPEAKFKKYLRQVSDDDEPAEPVSLSLVSDIHGTVKRFSTLRELMYWAGRANLIVLYGIVSDKYKLERAIDIGLGLWISGRSEARDFMLFLLFMMLNHGLKINRDPSGNDLTTAIQLIQSLLNQLHPTP